MSAPVAEGMSHGGEDDVALVMPFLTALMKLDRYDQRRPFRPWLLRIATNTAIDRRRHRRLTISLLTVNLLGGLDEWLHGTANLHGWGFSAAPDPVLEYVRGFDPSTDEFRYAVNGRFGATVGANGGFTVPFQIGLQAHLTLGPDRTRDRLRAVFGGRRGGPGAASAEGAGPPDFASRLARILPNPIPAILGFKDSLAYSAEQVAALHSISDSLDAQNKGVSDSLQAEVQKAGDRPDPGIMFARMRPRLNEGRENIRRALERARGVLPPEQWKKLPDALKAPGFRRSGPND